MKHFIKICGLANEQDILETIDLKPDALGFNFWPKSPRYIAPETVAKWTQGKVPAGMLKVGIFVNADADEIKQTATTAGLDILQLHGGESAEFAQSLGLPVWKVLHLDRLPEAWNQFPAECLLIDSGSVRMPGGTGHRVNTEGAVEFVKTSNLPVMLAGGLKASSVKDAIRTVRPAGVDVASGVEQAPGKKDMQEVRNFIQHARDAFLTV